MTIIRKNTNPRATDVAPQLQSVLHANGMQAHISLTETGTYQLVTLSHNSSQPRYYDPVSYTHLTLPTKLEV